MKKYFTISKRSGLLLNAQKTDFNVKAAHFAVFEKEEDAKQWIDENNNKFKSATTGLPVKLSVNQYSSN